jgi:hypothetical protein
VAFSFFLPIVGHGARVDVLGVSLSVAGLWGAWNVLVKGTLGVATTVILAASTPIPALLRGLDRRRVPQAFTSIAGFMVRYLDVITDEMRRMRVARLSRGYDPRWIWQVRKVSLRRAIRAAWPPRGVARSGRVSPSSPAGPVRAPTPPRANPRWSVRAGRPRRDRLHRWPP